MEEVSRRDALRISVAAAAMLVIGGCKSSGSSKEIDAASKDLGKALDKIASDDAERAELASIARRIQVGAREMLDDYRDFQGQFDTLSAMRDTTSDKLLDVARKYQARRMKLRNGLFRLQDELRSALTAEEWAEVVAILNRKAAAAGYRRDS